MRHGIHAGAHTGADDSLPACWRVGLLPNGACQFSNRPPYLVSCSNVLTPEQIQHFRDRLESEYAATQARIAGRRGEWPTSLQTQGSVGDSGDESSVEFERETELDENADDRKTLAQIRRALDRIDDGLYGFSEQSGEPIPIERLEAVPYATTLVDEALPEDAD